MINRTIAIDPIFNQLGLEGQWLYMRMLPFMDDYGKMTGNCIEIKYQCIPSSEVSPEWINNKIEEMAKYNLVAYKENICVQFLGFEKNQKIGHRRAKSKYPSLVTEILIDKERSEKVEKGRNNIIEDNKIENKPIKKKTTYQRPTLKEVEEYFFERKIPNYKENASKFWNHYESGNWYRGKTKIKKWKMCLKNWNFSEDDNKKETSGIDFSEFERNDINGEFTAYCSKCDAESFPRFPFEIAKGSLCCLVPFKPKKGVKHGKTAV
tara:strand:+ start:182 stop:976 length:795 start_codon:yes stop_codon:yes gene_type:complete